MTKLAVCGMGLLGRPMAARLLRTGHAVTVWNRTSSRTRVMAAEGAAVASTPAEAGMGVDVVITVLSTPAAVREVVLGEEGVARGMAETGGGTLVEMSTVGPAFVRDLATRLPAGVELVDAPVLGSVPQAENGELKVFMGGSEEAYRRLEPVFRSLGPARRVGPLGMGAAMKLMVNSTLPSMMATLGEALSLGDALGLGQGAMLDVLADSAIGATVRSKRSRIERDEYEPNFKLELALKDAVLVEDAARAAGMSLEVAGAARRLLEGAVAAGLGDLDYSALLAHVRGTPRVPVR